MFLHNFLPYILVTEQIERLLSSLRDKRPWLKYKSGFNLRALGLVAMSGHVGVTTATHFSVARGPWRYTVAPGAASSTCSSAHVWPRVQATPLLTQSSAVCHNMNYN